MVKGFLSVAVISILLAPSCNNGNGKNEKTGNKQPTSDTSSAKSQDIPFIVAKNYFAKNIVPQGSLENPKLETKENFDSLFGAATTMSGKPTEIDFSKQYVVAIIGDETDVATEISPISLQKNDKNEIRLTYRINKGNKQSFKIRPLLIVIVDKTHEGTVTVKEQTL